MDKFTKHEIALIAVGLLIASTLVIWVTSLAVEDWLAPDDTLDPLTQAGGLAPSQEIKNLN